VLLKYESYNIAMAEILTEKRTIQERALAHVKKYLPPTDLMEQFPATRYLTGEKRKLAEDAYPGADFVLSYYKGKPVMMPPWFPEFSSLFDINPPAQYGTALFEGGSLVAATKDGKATGRANIILEKPRERRLEKSMDAQMLGGQLDMPEFQKGIRDLAAVNAQTVLVDQKGNPTRAYIRPTVFTNDNSLGVGMKPQKGIKAEVAIWRWGEYYGLTQEGLDNVLQNGLRTVVSPQVQRREEITAKRASNYGEPSVLSKKAQDLGYHEALYLAPFVLGEGGELEYVSGQDEKSIDKLAKDGILADASSAEVGLLVEDNKNPDKPYAEFWYPPKKVNRLGGTVLEYFKEHTINHIKATNKNLDITSQETTFSLSDIKELQKQGYQVTPMVLGNAATVLPIGELGVVNNLKTAEKDDKPLDKIETPPTELARQLCMLYRKEITGETSSTSDELLTEIDVELGREMNKILKRYYSEWFKPEELESEDGLKQKQFIFS
jgi:branched-subunit amino acid aminotransferase/4-amino-4-deoxychorismate lyase